MTEGKSFSVLKLNDTATGWGVVDDLSGALVHTDGLALKLTKDAAAALASELNEEASAHGSVVEDDERSP